MEVKSNKKSVLHTISFISAFLVQILWLNAVDNFYYVFVMRTVSVSELPTDSSFWITIGLFILSVSLLLIVEKTLRKWELIALFILIIIEIIRIMSWWFGYFQNALFRHFLYITFLLPEVIIFSTVVSVPLAIHIWILVKHRRNWILNKNNEKA